MAKFDLKDGFLKNEKNMVWRDLAKSFIYNFQDLNLSKTFVFKLIC